MLEEEFEEIADDYEEAKLLMTIPRISHFSPLLIFAEISDIDRFPDPEKLCSYAGPVPKVRQSGDHKKLGGSKKERDKFLQWILIECTWIHIGGSDSQLTKHYRRKKEEKDSKMAAIATANKMLTTIYYILKRGEEFRFQLPTKKRKCVAELANISVKGILEIIYNFLSDINVGNRL